MIKAAAVKPTRKHATAVPASAPMETPFLTVEVLEVEEDRFEGASSSTPAAASVVSVDWLSIGTLDAEVVGRSEVVVSMPLEGFWVEVSPGIAWDPTPPLFGSN
jgi:hypothetical protein